MFQVQTNGNSRLTCTACKQITIYYQEPNLKVWHDPEMTPMQRIQRLGDEVPDSPCDLENVTDENFKVKNVVMPSSEDLNAKFKFFLTMMFAAQNAHKRLLEASFKEQAETINLLHKSKYGSRVPEKYPKITKEEIQEMIKDMGWSQPQPSTSKRPLESSSKKPSKKVKRNRVEESEEDSAEVREVHSVEESVEEDSVEVREVHSVEESVQKKKVQEKHKENNQEKPEK